MDTACYMRFALIVVLLGVAENRVIKRSADVKERQDVSVLNKTNTDSILQMFLQHLQHNSTNVPQDVIDKLMGDKPKGVSRRKRGSKDALLEGESLLKWLIGCGCIKALFNVTDNRIKELPSSSSKPTSKAPYSSTSIKFSTYKTTEKIKPEDVTIQDRFETDDYRTSPPSGFTASQSQSQESGSTTVVPTDTTTGTESGRVSARYHYTTHPTISSNYPQTSESAEPELTTKEVSLEATDNGFMSKMKILPRITTRTDKKLTTSTTVSNDPKLTEYSKINSSDNLAEDKQSSSPTTKSNKEIEASTEIIVSTVDDDLSARKIVNLLENKTVTTTSTISTIPTTESTIIETKHTFDSARSSISSNILTDDRTTDKPKETSLSPKASVPACIFTTSAPPPNATESKSPEVGLCTTSAQREHTTDLPDTTISTFSTSKDEKTTTTASTKLKSTVLNPSLVESEVRQLFSTQKEEQTTILAASKVKDLDAYNLSVLHDDDTTEIASLEDRNMVKEIYDETTTTLEPFYASTLAEVTLEDRGASVNDTETIIPSQDVSSTEAFTLNDTTTKVVSEVIYSKSTDKKLSEEPLVTTPFAITYQTDDTTSSKIEESTTTTTRVKTSSTDNRNSEQIDESSSTTQTKQSTKLSTLPELISPSLSSRDKTSTSVSTSSSSTLLSSTTQRAESKSTTKLSVSKPSTSSHEESSTSEATAKSLSSKLSTSSTHSTPTSVKSTSAAPPKCTDLIKLCKCGQGVSPDGLITYLLKKIFDGTLFNWQTPTKGLKVLKNFNNARYPYKIAYENGGRVPIIYYYV